MRKENVKKYLKKSLVISATTMLLMNTMLGTPMLLQVSAAEETSVTKNESLDRTSRVKSELQVMYDEYKGFIPQYLEQDSYIEKYTEAVLNAEAILNKEDATIEEIQNATKTLDHSYWLVKTSDMVWHYSFTRGHFDYSLYLTDSVIDLARAYMLARNINPNNENTEQFKEWYQNFVDADTPVLATNAETTMVGINDGVISNGNAKQTGTFNITEEAFRDDVGELKIRLHISFVNDGLHPITKEQKTAWSAIDLANKKVKVEWNGYDGGYSLSSIKKADITSTTDGFEAVFVGKPGIYTVSMEKDSAKTASRGYYHSVKTLLELTLREQLEKALADARALDENIYTTKSWKDSKIIDAIKKAEYILNARPDLYQNGLDAIATAISKLIECDHVDYEAISLLVEEKEAIRNSIYTVDSWRTFKGAVAKGRNIVGTMDDSYALVEPQRVTQEEYDAVMKNIEDTELALVDATDKMQVEYGYVGQTTKYDHGGIFSIILEEALSNGKINLTVQFENNGYDPEDGKTVIGRYSRTVMENDLDVEMYDKENKLLETLRDDALKPLRNAKENGVIFNIEVDPGEYYFRTAGVSGTNKVVESSGYYRTKINKTDKSRLESMLRMTQSAIENEHHYTHNDAWNTFVEAYENGSVLFEDEAAKQKDIDNATQALTIAFLSIRMEADAPVFTGVEEGAYYNTDVTYEVYDQSLDVIIIDGVVYDDPTTAPRTITTEGEHTITAKDEPKGTIGIFKETTITFTIDKTAPTIIKINPQNDGTIMVKFTEPVVIEDENWKESEVDYEQGGQYWVGTLTEDKIYTVTAKDKAGNTVTFTVDHEAPKGTVTYSTTDPTNKGVTATISFEDDDVRLTNSTQNPNWTMSADRLSYVKTFNENVEEVVRFHDNMGNEVRIHVNVSNIDKVAPEVIKINPQNDGTIMVKFTEPVVIEDENWKESEVDYEQGGQYWVGTLTEDKIYTVTAKDKAGNIVTFMVDHEAPKGTVTYSTTDPTNKDVTATITFEDEDVRLTNSTQNPDWTMSADRLSYVKTFDGNVEEEVRFHDNMGNEVRIHVNVSNIDKVAPEVRKITPQDDGTILVEFTEPVVIEDENWKESKQGGQFWIGTLTEDKIYTVTAKDKAGNTVTFTVDHEAPKGTVTYSTTDATNGNVTVTITFKDEDVHLLDSTINAGWVVSEDGLTFTKTFTENGEEKVKFHDRMGNEVSFDILIENIIAETPVLPNEEDKEPSTQLQEGTLQTKDTTTLTLWLALLVLSSGGLIAIVYRKKKMNK